MSQRRRRTLRQRIDAIAAELEPRVRDAFLRATRDVTNRAQLGRIVRALETGDAEAALRAIGLDPGAYTDLTEELRAAFVRGGQATTTLMPTLFAADGSRLTIRFDPRNPQAEAWLRDYSSTLVTRIVDDQRQAIRQSLDAGMQAGRNPRSVALDIIGRVNPQSGRREGGIVGLTAQQERFARNAADELLSGDPTRMSAYFDRERRDRRFDRLVARAIREGRPLTQAEADKVLGRYRDRLLLLRGETIARTEMLTSLNASQRQAYEQAISEGAVERQNVVKVWRTARDARVRDTHRWISGQERAMDERFGNGLMYPGEPGAPAAEVINCFAPWAMVSVSGVKGCMTRQYAGDLVQLLIAGEVDLPVTPNHPILTARGWVPAGEVMEGDDLLYSPISGIGASAAEPKVGDAVASAEKLYDAAKALRRVVRPRGGAVDLHGEVPDEQVDVVAVDGRLRAHIETASEQAFPQPVFVDTDAEEGAFLASGAVKGSDSALSKTPSGFMGGRCAATPLLRRGESGSPSVAFAHIRPINAHVDQARVHNGPADPKGLRDAVDRVAIAQETVDLGMVGASVGTMTPEGGKALWGKLARIGFEKRRVRKVRRRHYEGPVFNFETVSHVVIGNGIVTHNCRCTVEHRIDFIAQNLGAEPTGPRPDSETGTGTDGAPQPRRDRPPRPVTVPPARVPSPPALPTGEAIAPQPSAGDLPPVPVPTSSPDLTGIKNIDALEQNALLRLVGAGFTAEQWGDVFSPHIRPEAPDTLFKRAVAVDESSVVFQGATDKTKVTRTLNLETGVANHTVLELDPQSQGQGLGKRILKESVAAYRRMGMSRVELSANIDVGGYAWAKYGFVPTDASWRKLRAELNRRLLRASVPDDVKLAVGKLLASDDPRMIWRIADLQAKNANGVKLGKALLLGTSWRGTLDLRDAESMERFDAYVAR